MKTKSVITILPAPEGHWVGDGFPVRSMFGDLSFTPEISPFLMLDYAGPTEFPATDKRRGVEVHPHKGFETVTIVYHGRVEHRDSAGHHGVIGPGDVQWMTAGAGVLHEEYHAPAFAKSGGLFEMVQLWVNLLARDKKHPPRYQPILDAQIPRVKLEGGGELRVIAGSIAGATGPAKTFTPIEVGDVTLPAGARAIFPFPQDHAGAIFVMKGRVTLAGRHRVAGPGLAILERDGEELAIESADDARLLVLGGKPIDEPIVARGPFVMNSMEEIRQAMRDYQEGQMG